MKDNDFAAAVDAAAASHRWALLTSSACPARFKHTFECFIDLHRFNHAPRSVPSRVSLRNAGLSVTSPIEPASHRAAGGLEVADSVDGDPLLRVCTVEMKVWRMVPLHHTHLDRRVCMFAWRSVNGCDRCGAPVSGVRLHVCSSAEVSAEVCIDSNNR